MFIRSLSNPLSYIIMIAFVSLSNFINVNAKSQQPNIILFLVDDMGWQDTSEPFLYDSNGNPIITALNQRYRTPNIEALADNGLKFTNAYAMPVCTPTRISLMTGKNSVNHKVTNWTNPDGTETGQNSSASHNSPPNWLMTGLQNSEITLPTILKTAGYRTITAGKAHFGPTNFAKDPLNVGFDVNIAGSEIGRPGSYLGDYGQSSTRPVPHLDQYHNSGTFLTEALTLEMNEAIEDAVNDNVPFYAQMAHYAVHSPFDEDPRFSGNYSGIPNDERNYATLVEGIDKSLGDMITKLQQLGIAEETLIIFMTDNGGDAPTDFVNQSNAPLRHKKGSQYEGGVRVPLIISWATPNSNNTCQANLQIPNGAIENDIVACFDIFPTISGLANASFSHSIDGFDLQPYIKATPGSHRPQNLLIHFPHDHRTDYYTIYRENEWKLIYNYVNDFYELYNLDNDISEATNLASAEPDRVMLMARKMAQELDANNAQWPTFDSNGQDDPFMMPNLPNVDIDGDGIPDNIEDPNFNGLVDAGETDPDVPESAGCMVGASCDDNETCTTNDVYNSNCVCIGTIVGATLTASLNPVADAFIRGGSFANDNYGNNNEIITKLATNNEFVRIGYLKFDLNGYYAADLVSATLEIKVTNNTAGSTNQNLFLIQDDSWLENGITWVNEPATTTLVANFTAPGTNQSVAINLTAAAISTLNENKILSLKIEGTNNQYVAYASREQGATAGPVLRLTTGGNCDDGDPCTIGETLDANCNCIGGVFQDADEDGVCDTNDVCAGGDDNIDTDNDNIADACDDCLAIFLELNNSNITSSKQANSIIQTNGAILQGNVIKYKAGQYVELLQNFEASVGAEFDVVIETCQ